MLHTEKEIWGQPCLWQKVYEQVLREMSPIETFLGHATLSENLNIIITGAGSSAFIGLSLAGVFRRNFKRNTMAVSTTDLVTHPLDYLSADRPLLLISLARSGNSPESVAAAHLADQICPEVFHLIITCDAKGALANFETGSSKYVFILPPESNDQGLAMTGSFTGMLLAGLLMARMNELVRLSTQISILVQYGQKLLDQAESFRQLAEMDFNRAVFLGSGPLFGTATESQLKVQELTDGKVICKCDSFLGFRHGPRVVIDRKTLVFLLLSNQSYVMSYETDLIKSLNFGQKPLCLAGLFESGSMNLPLDKVFLLSEQENQLEEMFLPVCFILPAQLIGYFKSLQFELNPDFPSNNGAISREVKGVIIYPFKSQNYGTI